MFNNSKLLDQNNSGFLFSISRIFQIIDNKSKRKFVYLSFFSTLTSISEVIMIYCFSDFLLYLQSYENLDKSELFLSNFFSINSIFQISLILTCITIFTTILRLFITWIGFKYQAEVTTFISKKVLSKIYKIGYENRNIISNSKKTSLLTNQVNSIGNAITASTLMVSNIFLGIGIFVGLLFKDGELVCIFGTTILLVYILLSKLTRKILINNSKVIASAQTNKIDVIKRFTQGIRETILESLEIKLAEKYFQNEKLFRTKLANNGFINSFPRFFIEACLIICISLLSAFYISDENLFIISELGAVSLGALRILPCIQSIYSGISSIRGISKSIFNIYQSCLIDEEYKFINKKENERDFNITERNKKRFLKLEKIEALNLSYQYPNSKKEIIKNFSITIKKGDKLAFLGESGVGKSTLMDILIGLIPCRKGKILFNNIDISEIKNEILIELRKKISCISLENHIPNQSIIEYITNQKTDNLKIDEIREAKKALRNAEFYKKVPINDSELLNLIGEECSNLSSGQKQRLILARSIYRNCDWLFLDEPTSSIDQETSIKILKKLIKNDQLTLLIITHDQEIAKLFDVKYILKDEKILPLSNYSI